ncbi:hypothetical protein [Staphylococcus pasteuri]|uniref:hypothetical protein n=1 Tax=Staphylococcus pasteuri TaxID=45972 RepID=UPI0012B9AD13|nr:hypothetical protein [Staphylococcus pasteuri]MCT1925723.1 hypothetical protein [Staphylococcus pasteuri]QQT11282.1 hypothetical protein I6J09_00640 [Staphylococcus pasteuri]
MQGIELWRYVRKNIKLTTTKNESIIDFVDDIFDEIDTSTGEFELCLENYPMTIPASHIKKIEVLN